MEKKKIKIGLVPKLIIAIIVGILFGQFFPEGFCRFVVTLSGFFSTFLKFVIPLMILAYVTMGIADLSQGAGKLLLITVALAYGSTLIAGSASYLVSSNLFPHFMSEGALDQIAATADASLTPYFSITLSPVMDTLPAASALHLRNFHRYDYFRKNICYLKHPLESVPCCNHHASDLHYDPVLDRRYCKQEESFYPDQKPDPGIYHSSWNPVFRSYHSGQPGMCKK